MLRRLKGKHGAAMPTKFEFTLQLHSLEPWPAPAANATPRPVALHWSRGSQVRTPLHCVDSCAPHHLIS